MAQIIKHRRGSIGALKDVTANVGELVMATGSIGDLNAPVLFIGESAIAGGYKPVSKIYQGASAPTLGAAYGSTMDGTPFYSNNSKTLYILDRTGNIDMDLTGNIEGNTISAVTINNITGTTAYIANMSGSFTGSGEGLYNIPATGITGLNLSKIYSGSVEVKTDSVTGDIHINADDAIFVSGVTFNVNAATNVTGSMIVTGDVTVQEDLYVSGNIYQTGSFYTQGDIVLSGSIVIGNSLTGDTINFGGEVSSSIIPQTHNVFDLGSPSKNWRNIHVSGTAYIDVLEAQQVNFNDLGILTDLVVSGSTYLGNGGDITVVSGSLYNDQLTEKRMVVVGAEGLLTDYSGITFDNGNLNLSGALEVTNIQGTGSLYLKPDLNDSRDFRIYNTAPADIHIKGNAAYSFFGDDTNYLKIDDNASEITITSVSGISINTSKTMVTGSLYNDQLTDNRVLVAGPNGLIGDSQYFTYDEVTLRAGAFEVDIISGDTRTSGSLLVKNGMTLTGSFRQKDSASDLEFIGNGFGETYIQNTTGNFILNPTNGSVELRGTKVEIKPEVGMNSSLEVTGSVTAIGGIVTDNINGITNITNSLHLNGGTFGAPHVELTSLGQISLFSEGSNSDFAINMTGSVYITDNLNVTGAFTVNGETTFNNDLTVNGVLTVTGNTQLQSNLYVSGNLEVLGSSTNVNIQSTTVEIGDNIILVNAYSPFQRYAGITGYDSGSVGNSGSMLWDSLNNFWLLQNSDASTSKVIGTTSGSMGSEVSLTDTYFPIATGANTIGDSLLRYSGTTLSFNTNKFTIESVSGNTYIGGNVTIVDGGIDNGSLTSLITFRNDDNILGFIDSTDTQDVTTQLLGYDELDGTLKFSSLIDGGTY